MHSNNDDITLSLQDLIQLPDLDQAAVGEFPVPVLHHVAHATKAYCSRCGMNWASLWTEDVESSNETYEFCPICKTDSFLEDPLDGPLYVSKVFDGIINVETGERYVPPARQIRQMIAHYRKPRKPFDREKWMRELPYRDDFNLYPIEQYQAAFATGGQEAGMAAWKEATKMDFDTWLTDIKGIDRATI